MVLFRVRSIGDASVELHEALTQIAEIRRQMARSQVFRGYRAAPAAFSGGLALAAAALQAVLIPDPALNLGAYLALWIGAAAVSAAATAMVMVSRSRLTDSPYRIEITWLAIEQFLPALVAGGLVTLTLVEFAPQSCGLLPGLWQIFFSLGLFASCRLLPRETFLVAVFYLSTGLACLMLAGDGTAFSPWAMGIPFGIGQFLAAAVLYWTLERNHGET
jgi:hypothetical protein